MKPKRRPAKKPRPSRPCCWVAYLDHEAKTGSAWIETAEALGKSLGLTALGHVVGETADYLVMTVSGDKGEAMTPFRIVKGAIVRRIDFDEEQLLRLIEKAGTGR